MYVRLLHGRESLNPLDQIVQRVLVLNNPLLGLFHVVLDSLVHNLIHFLLVFAVFTAPRSLSIRVAATYIIRVITIRMTRRTTNIDVA